MRKYEWRMSRIFPKKSRRVFEWASPVDLFSFAFQTKFFNRNFAQIDWK